MPVPSADKKSLSHRLRWLAVGTALAIAAIVGANALILVQLRHSTLREVQDNLLRQSLGLSELVERTLQATDLMLTSVAERASALAATDDGTQQLESEAFHIFLHEKMAGLPQIHVLGLLDANGMRSNYALFWPAPKIDTSFREHFQVLKSNPKMTSYLDAPELGTVTGEWVAIEARPVHAKDGKFFGVVFASTSMKYFDDLFRSTSMGEGYAITLLRKDGTLLTRYPMAGQIGMKVPASVLATLSDSRSGVSRSISPVDGQARIAAAYSLMKYPLVVIVTQEEVAAFAPWRRTAITMGIIAAGDDRPCHHRRLADRTLVAATGAPQRRASGNHRIRQGPRARRSRTDPPAGFGGAEQAFYRRRREHDAGTVHDRRRRAAGRVQRALRQDVSAATGVAHARHIASRHHRPPCPQWPPEGRSRQRRRAAAIIGFVGATRSEKIEPDRRTCRRNADPRDAVNRFPAAAGSRPTTISPSSGAPKRSCTRPSNFWIRSSTTFRLRWS